MVKMNKKDFKKLSKGVAFDKVVTPLYDDLDKAEVLLTEAKEEAKIAQAEAKTAQARAEDAEAEAKTAQARAEDAEAKAKTAQARAEDAEAKAKTAQARAEDAEAKANDGLYLTEDVRNRLDNLVDAFNTAETEYSDIEADMNETISVKERVSRLAEKTLHSTDIRPDAKDIIFNALSNEVKYNERQINKSIHELQGINSKKNRLCQKIGELVLDEVV